MFKQVRPFIESGKLLLDEYDYGEQAPRCPYNCGNYHYGRQKYAARSQELNNPLLMMWTHALAGQDYLYADRVMAQMNQSLLGVHHYQAWWYLKEGSREVVPEALRKGGLPVPRAVLDAVGRAIKKDPALESMYLESPGRLGVTWVQPLVSESGQPLG